MEVIDPSVLFFVSVAAEVFTRERVANILKFSYYLDWFFKFHFIGVR